MAVKKRILMAQARQLSRKAEVFGWKSQIDWYGYQTQIWHGRMQPCAVTLYLIRGDVQNPDYLDIGWNRQGQVNGVWGRIDNKVLSVNNPEKLICK